MRQQCSFDAGSVCMVHRPEAGSVPGYANIPSAMLHNAIELTRCSLHSMRARCWNSRTCLEFQVTCLTLKSCFGAWQGCWSSHGQETPRQQLCSVKIPLNDKRVGRWPGAPQTVHVPTIVRPVTFGFGGRDGRHQLDPVVHLCCSDTLTPPP